jgi:hypothetical protein
LFERPLIKATISCHRLGASHSRYYCVCYTHSRSWETHSYDVTYRPHKLSGVYSLCVQLIGWSVLIWMVTVHSSRISRRGHGYTSHKNQQCRKCQTHFLNYKIKSSAVFGLWALLLETVEPSVVRIRFYTDIVLSFINEFSFFLTPKS